MITTGHDPAYNKKNSTQDAQQMKNAGGALKESYDKQPLSQATAT